MKDFNSIIGKNLCEIRKQKGLSLDKTSDLTGVSKAMLGQIERGESNPTVATLWKIANGLKVSFSSFLEEKFSTPSFASCNDIDPIAEDGGRIKIYPLFPFDSKRGFEVFTILLEPGCKHISEPHNEGVEEYILVTQGTLELVIEDNAYHLNSGDAIRFYANRKHMYYNTSNSITHFQNIIYYSF